MSTNETQTTKPRERFGLMKARIGSQHVVIIDGKRVIFVVRSLDDFPNAKRCVRCIGCRQQWPTTEECAKAHPDYRVLEQAKEKHVWAWWSDDLIREAEPLEAIDPKTMSEKKVAELRERNEGIQARNRLIPIIGFLSDEGF